MDENDISDALDNGTTDSIYQKFILTGDLGKKKRKQIFSDIQESIINEIPFCILSTGSLIGEGFDMPELDTLILAMPISFRGRIIQYAGRIHREHRMKQDVIIYDYLDPSSGLTISMFKKRVRAHEQFLLISQPFVGVDALSFNFKTLRSKYKISKKQNLYLNFSIILILYNI